MFIFKLLKKLLWLLLILTIIIGGALLYLSFKNPSWKEEISTPTLPTTFECSDIEKEIKKYDWDRETALAIAKAESDCDANSRGDEDLTYENNGREYGYSVGAFQVRILEGREECDTFDLETNVKCAYNIYSDKGDFSDWSMYENGRYKLYKRHNISDIFKMFMVK